MRKNEVLPDNMVDVFIKISGVHGPSRYEEGRINGAISCVQHGDEFPDGIYAWFVGSPRAFLFGFERNKSWASRRMRSVLRNEYQQIN